MGFYILCHVFIGIAASCSHRVYRIRNGELPISEHPAWFMNSRIHDYIIMLGASAPVVACVTSLFDQGWWVLATIVEIFIGYMAYSFLVPVGIGNLIYITSPVTLTIIYGALWGFWYI